MYLLKNIVTQETSDFFNALLEITQPSIKCEVIYNVAHELPTTSKVMSMEIYNEI